MSAHSICLFFLSREQKVARNILRVISVVFYIWKFSGNRFIVTAQFFFTGACEVLLTFWNFLLDGNVSGVHFSSTLAILQNCFFRNKVFKVLSIQVFNVVVLFTVLKTSTCHENISHIIFSILLILHIHIKKLFWGFPGLLKGFSTVYFYQAWNEAHYFWQFFITWKIAGLRVV